MTGFRRVSGEGPGLALADGLVSWALLADGGGGHRCAGMTKRGFARLPGRGEAGRAELAEWLLASQGTGAKKSGGQIRQASLSRRAGPAACDRSTARRRAGRGSPQTCLPS
jgi:hypothetical protein